VNGSETKAESGVNSSRRSRNSALACQDAAMRILVTNDDGIDSIGLHVLTRSMCELTGDHEIVVAAPDTEYSGASASLGALHLIRPEVRVSRIEECAASAVWAVTGPPALCVMFSRLGAFGPPFDLVVSGINPGANVGRAVYHSGTIGAALTARSGGISGVAVSQSVSGFAVEGQAWDESLRNQHWQTAADVAKVMVQGLVDDMPTEPVVLNINVPDVPLEDVTKWTYGVVGSQLPRSMAGATLEPVPGHEGAFHVAMSWGQAVELAPETDGGIVERGEVSISYLTRLAHEERDDVGAAIANLETLLAR
jgi:5'-nucleotidase